MNRSKSKNNYESLIFRELKTPDEILASFRLRYDTYRSSRLNCLCQNNSEMLDVDQWDIHSRHFGVFASKNNEVKLIGSVRVIYDKETTSAKALDELSRKYSSISSIIYNSIPYRFYCSGYKEIANEIDALLLTNKFKLETVVEYGRLVIQEEFQSIEVIRFFSESILAIGVFGTLDVDQIILTCNYQHKKIYNSYGFFNIPQTIDKYWEKLHAKGSALTISRNNIPISICSRLKLLANVFDTFGSIELQPKTEYSRAKIRVSLQVA